MGETAAHTQPEIGELRGDMDATLDEVEGRLRGGLGRRPKTLQRLKIFYAAFLGRSVKRSSADCAQAANRLVGRTSSGWGDGRGANWSGNRGRRAGRGRSRRRRRYWP